MTRCAAVGTGHYTFAKSRRRFWAFVPDSVAAGPSAVANTAHDCTLSEGTGAGGQGAMGIFSVNLKLLKKESNLKIDR